VLVGISCDSLQLQEKFSDKEKLDFPLLSDADGKVAKEFGVLIPGKTMASRATFVIGKNGVVAKIFSPVKNAGGHPQEVLDYVKEKLVKK
jgi:peroxiredoxin Q/BCP